LETERLYIISNNLSFDLLNQSDDIYVIQELTVDLPISQPLT